MEYDITSMRSYYTCPTAYCPIQFFVGTKMRIDLYILE